MTEKNARDASDDNNKSSVPEITNLRQGSHRPESGPQPASVGISAFHKSLVPCQFACHLRVNIPEMLQAASAADWAAAWKIFSASSPLPFSAAYLCRGECRKACHPHKDHPSVDVRRIEQTAAKHMLESDEPESSGASTRRHDMPARFSGWRLDESALDTGDRLALRPQPRESMAAVMDEPAAKAAIVGSAPAALSAAYHLALAGYEVTAFSSEQSLGGWLQDAAAGACLPLAALRRDLARLTDMGIQFAELSSENDDYRNLRDQGYDVVLVAPQMVNAERRAALVRHCFRGLVDANAFVRAANRHALPLPGKIIVLGTGFDSIDTARVALARGCKEVTLLLHATPCESPVSGEEIKQARQEGIQVRYCDFLQTRIERKDNIFEVRIPGSMGGIAGQMILLDGSTMPHTADEGATITLGPARPSALAIDVQTMITDMPGVFAIDPIRLANNSLAEELAQGEDAARIAREFVEGRVMEPALIPVWMDARQTPKRTGGTMSATLIPKSPAQEAARCAKCNKSVAIDNEKCIGCLKCLEGCNIGALYATDESGRPLAHPWRGKPVIRVDNHLCEHCGACVNVCPTKAISMKSLTLRRSEPSLPMIAPKEENTAAWQRYTEWAPETQD
jgi:NADPH-dependent glutamate synthase beta subunit-like oxidoreductase/ferredoxin